MKLTAFDPKSVLGINITKMGRQELCEFASKLCRRVVAEVGTRGRRGGIYPSNISLDANGNIALGPSGVSPWRGEELNFVAPELYWNGQCGAPADVYSVGLLLYYAISGGKLPLEDECQDAQLRRMGGDDLEAPRNAGRRLATIIEKATRFKPADRYQTMEELRVVLDSCIKNLYLSGVPSAEAIFKKNDDDLNDVERMMVGIIEKTDSDEDKTPDPKGESEEVKVYSPAPSRSEASGRAVPPEAVAKQLKSTERPAVPKLSEEKHPVLQPVVPGKAGIKEPPVQYTRSAEREKKIAEEVKKRRRRPLAVILVLCALLVVVAIIFNAMLKDFQAAKLIPDNTGSAPASSDPYSGTMPPQGGDQDIPTEVDVPGTVGEVVDLPQASVTPAKESGYDFFLEDVSWTQARDKCIALGGHLVVINDAAEFNDIVAMAEANGANKVWIGCYRQNDELKWVNGQDGYFLWAKGEPSYMDVNDNVSEDYVMLWDNKGWAMNDNRNDPIADYPQWYSGTVGYVCEYGN